MERPVFGYLLVVCVIFCAPAACTELNYRLGVQRADDAASDQLVDIVTLQCRNYSTSRAINLQQNENIKFWLDRQQPDDEDLRSRFSKVSLTRDGTGIRFALRDVGEGDFSCGVRLNQANVDESLPVTLIALQTVFNNLVFTTTTSFFVASGNSVTLRCPVQPHTLYNFYYGQWTKNGEAFIWINQPSIDGITSAIQGNKTKYSLDQQTFSVTINFADTSTDSSSDYRCELRSLNPLSGSTQVFSQAAGLSLSLMVNEAPTILLRPKPFVIGRQEASANPPTFTCSLGGAPEPTLQWTYIPSLSGDELFLTSGEDYNITYDITMEDNGSGRSVVSSTLKFLSITDTDGGIVRCKSVSNRNSASADALLTILGEPENIEVFLSRESGIVIYELDLAVEMQSPFMLNATYTNRENISHHTIIDTIYNNTKSVSHRDVIGQLRDEAYFISFSLIAVNGSDLISGPLKQRDEIIDTTTMLPLIIIVPAVVGGAVVLFLILVLLIAVILLARHKKQKLDIMRDLIKPIRDDPEKFMTEWGFEEKDKEQVRKTIVGALRSLSPHTRRRTDGDEDGNIEIMTDVLFDSLQENIKSDLKSKLSQTVRQYTYARHDTQEELGSEQHPQEAPAQEAPASEPSAQPKDRDERTQGVAAPTSQQSAFGGPSGEVHVEVHDSKEFSPTDTIEQ